MPGLIAHDAEKRLLNASEAVSARKFDDSQAKWKELLVCTVERGGQAKNERNWALFEDEQGGGRINSARNPETYQRRGRANGRERLHVRIVRGINLSSRLSTEVEGLNGHDRT